MATPAPPTPAPSVTGPIDSEFKDLSDNVQKLAQEMVTRLGGASTKAADIFKASMKDAAGDVQAQLKAFEKASKKINLFNVDTFATFGVDAKKYGDELINISKAYQDVSTIYAALQAKVRNGTITPEEQDQLKKYAERLNDIEIRYQNIGGRLGTIDQIHDKINQAAVDYKRNLEDSLEPLQDQADKMEEIKRKAASIKEAGKVDFTEILGGDQVKAEAFDAIKKGVDHMKSGKGFFGSIKAMAQGAMQALNGMFGVIVKNWRIIGGIGIVLGVVYGLWWGISKLISGSSDRAQQIDKASEEFRKNTGLTKEQMQETVKHATELSRELTSMGVNLETAFDASSKLVQEFGLALPLAKETVGTVSLLSANFGIAAEESAKVLRNFMGMGGLTEESATNVMRLGSFLASKAGVPTKVIFQDIASAADDTHMFLSQSPMLMMKMAVEARRLGTSLASITKSSRGMLNYQESIQNEMQLSALLGRSVNAQRVRELVYENNLIGARKEAIRQIKELGDLNRLNFYQREAVVKLYGMEWNEINKMIAQEKALYKIKERARSGDQKALELLNAYNKAMENRSLETDRLAEIEAMNEIKSTARMGQLGKIQANLQSFKLKFTGFLDSTYDSILGLGAGATNVLSETPEQLETDLEKSGEAAAKAAGEAFKAQSAMQMQGKTDITNKLTSTMRAFYKQFSSTNFMVDFRRTIDSITAGYDTLVNKVKSFFGNIPSKIGEAFNAVKDKLRPLIDATKALFKSTRMYGDILKNLAILGGKALGAISWALKKVLSPLLVAKGAWDSFTESFKSFSWEADGFWGGFGRVLESLSKMPMIVYDNTIGALLNIIDIAVEYFGGPNGLIRNIVKMVPDGLGMIGELIGDALVWAIWTAWPWVKKAWQKYIIEPLSDGLISFFSFGKKFGKGIEDAVRSIPGLIGDAFNSAKKRIKEWLGFSPSVIGELIVLGIQSVGRALFNSLVDPFKEAWKAIQELPLYKTFFGGPNNMTSQISDTIKSLFDGKQPVIVEVMNREMKETMDRLTDAIVKLGGSAGSPTPIVNVNNNTNQLIQKIDELISVFKDKPPLEVNIDGIRASKLLARSSF